MFRLVRVLLLFAFAASLQASRTVTLVHFSDYHSHAVPHYTEAGMRGGIARAIGAMKRERRHGALVFSGGDMINRGAPAWSDRYGCAEWPWLNEVVDAMAFGNHEPDYGRAAFDACRAGLRYPILSANTPGFEPYRVFVRNGIRVGVFAVAGSDFERLGVAKNLSDGGSIAFSDSVEAARNAVQALMTSERADIVVMIGHEHADSDEALARAVPGIDLIFGTHSHLERPLQRIEGTRTWFVSSGQYLANLARVEVTVDKGEVTGMKGGLVPVDGAMREDRAIARRVRKMQRELEADPQTRALFLPIGTLPAPLTLQQLATRTLDVMRGASGASVALSTTSSFRGPLPAGTLTMELLRGVLPYDNEIVVCDMSGVQLEAVLAESRRRAGTDSELIVAGPAAVDAAANYRVAVTDYVANVAYRDQFSCSASKTGLRVRDELRKSLTR